MCVLFLCGPMSARHRRLVADGVYSSRRRSATDATKAVGAPRSRDSLDLPLLQILKDAGARPHPRITVELFDRANYELDITSTISRSNDSATIRGTFKPPSKGDFTFVVNGSILVGTMQLGGRLYKTEHIANGRLQLLEIDPEKMPPD